MAYNHRKAPAAAGPTESEDPMSGEIVNVEQDENWNREGGETWAAHWEHFDRSLQAYQDRLAAAAAVVDGEHVLDVGCGNGRSSREAARATPSGGVLGIDLSRPMLERARQLAAAEGLTNVEHVRGDAQVHPFEPERFQLAMSRFGSMFFADPVQAFGNVGRALAPGGRLVLVVWQSLGQNEQFHAIVDALGAGRELPGPAPGAPSPFALADPETGRETLGAAGFVEVEHTDVRAPFRAGADADEALRFLLGTGMARGLLEGLDASRRAVAVDDLAAAVRRHESAGGVVFPSAGWIITARRP